MNWFLIEDTREQKAPQHRYVVDAEFLDIQEDMVSFYAEIGDRCPTRIVKLAPGQIIFKANQQQAEHISQQTAAQQVAGPKPVVQ